MGKYNISEELINKVEILLHKESSTVHRSNHLPPSPSIIQDAITVFGSNSEDTLRCNGCHGELLRGSDSIICIFCGGFPDNSVTTRDPIRFTDTLGFRLFLGSLSLDGSESVERPIKGGNEYGRGRSTVKNEIPLSALLDLQLRWPDESNKFGVENDADKQSAKFVGINFDELLQTDGSREGTFSSLNEQNVVNKNIEIKKDTTFAGQGSLSLFENSQIGPREVENDESDWASEFQSANTDAQVDSGIPINSIHQPLKQEESAKIAGFQALQSAVESKFEPSFESNQSGSNMTAKDGQMGLGTVDASFDWLPASEKQGITDKIDTSHQPLKQEESTNIADFQALPSIVESKFEPSFESNQSGSNVAVTDGQTSLGTVDASFGWLPADDKQGMSDQIDPPFNDKPDDESINNWDEFGVFSGAENNEASPPTGGGFEIPDTWNGFTSSVEAGSNRLQTNLVLEKPVYGDGDDFALFGHASIEQKETHVESTVNMTTNQSDSLGVQGTSKEVDDSFDFWNDYKRSDNGHNNQQFTTKEVPDKVSAVDTYNVENDESFDEWSDFAQSTGVLNDKPVSDGIAFGALDDFSSIMVTPNPPQLGETKLAENQQFTTKEERADKVSPAGDGTSNVENDEWSDFAQSAGVLNDKPVSGGIAFGALDDFSSIMVTPNPPQIGETKLAENQHFTTKEEERADKVSPAGDGTSNVEKDEWSDFAQSTGVLNSKPISDDIAFGALDDFTSIMVTPNPPQIGETKLAENQQFTTKEEPIDKVSPAGDGTSNVENDEWSDFAQSTGVLNSKPISDGALDDFSSITVSPKPPQIGETKLAENQQFTTKEEPIDKVSPAGDGTSNGENDEWSDFAQSTGVLNSKPISDGALDDFSSITVSPKPPKISETKSAENQTTMSGEDDFGSWSDFRNSSKQQDNIFPELNLNGLKQDGIGTGRDVDTLSPAEDNKSHNSRGNIGWLTPALEQPSYAVEVKPSEGKLTSGDRDIFLGFDYSNIQSSLPNNQLKSNEWGDFAQSTGVLNSKPNCGHIAFGALDDFSSIMVTPNPPQIDEPKSAENQTAVPDEDDFGSWSDFRSSSKQPDSSLPELNFSRSKQDSIGSGRDVDNLSSAEDKKSDNSWGDLRWSTPILEQPSHAVESKPSESILTSKDGDLFLGFDYSTTQPSLHNNQFNSNGSAVQNGESTSVNDVDDDKWSDFVGTNKPRNNVKTDVIQEPVIHDPFGEWNIIGSAPIQASGNVTAVTNEKFSQINVFSNNADSQFVGSKSSMPLDPFLFMLNDQNSSSHLASADTNVPNLFGTENQEGIADNADNKSETGFMEQHDQKSDVVESSLSIPKPEQQDTHVESMRNMTTNLSESLGVQGTSKEVNYFFDFWNDYKISDTGVNSQQQFTTKEAPVDKVSPAGDGKSNVKNDVSSDEWSDFAQSTGVLSSKPISSDIAFGELDDFSSKIDETKSAENQTAMPDEDDFGSWSDFRSSWKQPDTSFLEVNLNGSKQDSSSTGKDVNNLSLAEDKKSHNSWGDIGWSIPVLKQPSHAVEAKLSESILTSNDRDLFLGFDFSNTQPSLPNNQFNSNGSALQNGKFTSVNDEDDDTWSDFVSSSKPGNNVETDVIQEPVNHDPFGEWNVIGSAPIQASGNVTAVTNENLPQTNLFNKNADSLFIGSNSSMPQDPFLFMLNDQNGSSPVPSAETKVPNLFGMEHQDGIPGNFDNQS